MNWTNSRAVIAEAESYLNETESSTWSAVTLEEMKVFLGLAFAMGIIKKPTITSYWSTEPLMKTEYFNKCMSRDRFLSILRYIRFSSPHDVDRVDRNSRVSGILDLVNAICLKFVPSQRLSLDETLLLHKGRLQFRMFIRTKRARFGIKTFMLCDKSGYMLQSLVYYGAGTNMECNEAGTERLSKSEKIVIILLSKSNLLDKGYIITLDNWYNSARLAEFLWSRNTDLSGTVRPNRGIPQQLHVQQKDLAKYESAYMRKGPCWL